MPCPLLPTKIVWGLDFYLNRPKIARFYIYLSEKNDFNNAIKATTTLKAEMIVPIILLYNKSTVPKNILNIFA